jgi:hypothetical protein
MDNKPQTKYLEQPPAGWFVLDVMRSGARGGDWTALMVDVDPDDLKNCACEFPALFYVDPKDYRPGSRIAHQGWVRIAGKHRSRTAACKTLENMMATRQ